MRVKNNVIILVSSLTASGLLIVIVALMIIGRQQISYDRAEAQNEITDYTVTSWSSDEFDRYSKGTNSAGGVRGVGGAGYATNISKADLLSYTNDQREDNNLPPLVLQDKLNSSAVAKAKDMSAKNYWSHNAPDGTEPWIFIRQYGYEYSLAGENLAYGYDSSFGVVSGWINSPAHRANVLGDYMEVGFGIVNSPNYQGGPVTIVVAHYGKPL